MRSGRDFVDLGFAKVDTGREERVGFPEVIYCEGKQPEEAVRIAEAILGRSDQLLATRANPQHFTAFSARFPMAVIHERARCITIENRKAEKFPGKIGVICAGTSDLPVAEEAAVTLELFGNDVARWNDVGVAGIHRLLAFEGDLRACNVLVVVAGMEGALPSVVAGLVDIPVIAVPTSVGYGASFKGVAALLGMLNSCGSGVTVVNIDNGFGAGYAAATINRTIAARTARK